MKIPHITIYVSDLEASIAFFKAVACIDIQVDLRQFGKPIVFLADAKEDTKVELIGRPEEVFTGHGISIGFKAEDAEKELERVKALGYPTTPMISPGPGTKFFFVTGPDGVQVQIIE